MSVPPEKAAARRRARDLAYCRRVQRGRTVGPVVPARNIGTGHRFARSRPTELGESRGIVCPGRMSAPRQAWAPNSTRVLVNPFFLARAREWRRPRLSRRTRALGPAAPVRSITTAHCLQGANRKISAKAAGSCIRAVSRCREKHRRRARRACWWAGFFSSRGPRTGVVRECLGAGARWVLWCRSALSPRHIVLRGTNQTSSARAAGSCIRAKSRCRNKYRPRD